MAFLVPHEIGFRLSWRFPYTYEARVPLSLRSPPFRIDPARGHSPPEPALSGEYEWACGRTLGGTIGRDEWQERVFGVYQ